ncbi:hypothetical protein GCM10028801_26270 [Nocardioides maradonensis]
MTVLPPADVLWRSMSPSRMRDAGMADADIAALLAATDEGGAWDVVLEELAVRRLAEARAASGAAAVEAYRLAAADLLFAQMAFNTDVPRKVELYERFAGAVADAAQIAGWESVTVPFGAGRLHGLLVRPTGPAAGTVLVFGGQSGWGAAYLRAADALVARGLAALLVEGPGQGLTRFGGVMLDVDVPAAYSSLVDVALADPTLGGAVGLWGNSMGGLYAGTTAARDRRISAICVNGAPARPRLLGFRTFDEQAAAMLGTTDLDRVQANLDRLALPDDDRIAGAVLVLHGGADPIVSLAEQQPFLDATDRATLRVWDDGEHTIYNHADERTAFVADWFAEHLRPAEGA